MSNDVGVGISGPSITLGKAICIYAMSAVAMILLGILLTKFPRSNFLAIVTFSAYFVLGIWLNRTVLRGLVEWHPIYNTLDNVASAKLWTMLLWPIRYPPLFFQLIVSKYL